MMGLETIFGQPLIEWISLYGYWILAPLLVVEGPVVGFTCGILISYGVLEPVPVFLIYVAATTLSDSFLYYSAKRGAPYLLRFRFSRRIIQAIHRDHDKPERGWTNVLEDNFLKFFIFAKLSPTIAVSESLAVAAGILQIPAKRVYIGILSTQPIWSAGILALGFYFGSTFQDISFLLNVTGIFFTALVILVVLYFTYLHEQLIRGTSFHKMVQAWRGDDKKGQ